MKNILCLLLLAGALNAQAQNDLLHHIPVDADKVYRINLGVITAKLDLPSLLALAQNQHMGHKNLSPEDLAFVTNSGIDLHQDVLIAVSNAYHLDSAKLTTIILHLTDSAKFAAQLRKMHGLHHTHLANHDQTAADTTKAFAWNDQLAVVLITKPPVHTAAVRFQPAKLAQRCLTALHGTSGGYFFANPKVAEAFADDADVHTWERQGFGLAQIAKLLQGNPAAAQLNGFAAMAGKGSQDATLADLRFEPGKIVWHSRKLITPAEETYYKKLTGQGFDNQISAVLPPGQLIALMTMHYDLAVFADTIAKMPNMGMIFGKLKDKGFSFDDVAKGFKGDFVFAAYAPMATTEQNPLAKMPGLYLLASVGDKAALSRVLTATKVTDVATADTTTDTAKPRPFRYCRIQNNYIVFAQSRESANAFFDHPAANSSKLLAPQEHSGYFTMGFDMQTTKDFLGGLLNKGDGVPAKNQALLDNLGKMDALRISIGGINDDVFNSYVELRMTDQSRNSLATLLDIVAGLSKSTSHDAQ
jgi:hypothetical protein